MVENENWALLFEFTYVAEIEFKDLLMCIVFDTIQ